MPEPAPGPGPAETIPWWWGPALSVVLGGISGGVVPLLIGPTKAEKEERGKRRIEARREVGLGLRTFRYRLTEYRLDRFNLKRGIDFDAVEEAAIALAITLQDASHCLPLIERNRLLRDANRLLGKQLMRTAFLRTPEEKANFDDSAQLAAIALERGDPGSSHYSRKLREAEPTDPAWGRILASIDRVRRRYP